MKKPNIVINGEPIEISNFEHFSFNDPSKDSSTTLIALRFFMKTPKADKFINDLIKMENE